MKLIKVFKELPFKAKVESTDTAEFNQMLRWCESTFDETEYKHVQENQHFSESPPYIFSFATKEHRQMWLDKWCPES